MLGHGGISSEFSSWTLMRAILCTRKLSAEDIISTLSFSIVSQNKYYTLMVSFLKDWLFSVFIFNEDAISSDFWLRDSHFQLSTFHGCKTYWFSSLWACLLTNKALGSYYWHSFPEQHWLPYSPFTSFSDNCLYFVLQGMLLFLLELNNAWTNHNRCGFCDFSQTRAFLNIEIIIIFIDSILIAVNLKLLINKSMSFIKWFFFFVFHNNWM